MQRPILATLVLATASLLAACSSTQYIMSTREGRLIVADGKPAFDEKTGTYVYKDSEGKKTSIPKGDVVQIMER